MDLVAWFSMRVTPFHLRIMSKKDIIPSELHFEAFYHPGTLCCRNASLSWINIIPRFTIRFQVGHGILRICTRAAITATTGCDIPLRLSFSTGLAKTTISQGPNTPLEMEQIRQLDPRFYANMSTNE